MSQKIFNKGLLVCLLLFSVNVFAGFEHKSGGDECERRIKNISKDIKLWIEAGGSDGLELPRGLDLSSYNSKMLSALNETSEEDVSCVSHTLKVSGVEKTCVNYVNEKNKNIIECNIERFNNNTSKSGQYRLVHHEYAGLAGIEDTRGEASSNYEISGQLTNFLEEVTELKLVIKRPEVSYLNVCLRSPQIISELTRGLDKSCEEIGPKELVRIEEIDLSHRDIKGLKVGDFDGLIYLERLDLSFNKIENISASMFRGLHKLRDLNLRNNRIKNVPENVFFGLNNLEIISLSFNDISSIPDNLFLRSRLLTQISLVGLGLDSLPRNLFSGMYYLKILTLARNSFTTLPAGIFSDLNSLTQLNLRENKLTSIESHLFKGLMNLYHVNLGDNQIDTIFEDSFGDLIYLESLELSNNILKDVPKEVFSNLKSAREIKMHNNPLNELIKFWLREKHQGVISFE